MEQKPIAELTGMEEARAGAGSSRPFLTQVGYLWVTVCFWRHPDVYSSYQVFPGGSYGSHHLGGLAKRWLGYFKKTKVHWTW